MAGEPVGDAATDETTSSRTRKAGPSISVGDVATAVISTYTPSRGLEPLVGIHGA
jgi:hypothetical protein